MFVLPPPPRAAPSGTQVLETHNTISRPSGPEYQLVVGEGTYMLRDDLHLSIPPPHPSEAPVHNPNPLATNIAPPTTGTKLSVTIVAPKQSSLRHLLHSETPNSVTSTSQSQTDDRDYEKPSASSDTGSWRKSNGMSDGMRPHLPAFGDGNPALAPASGKTSKDASKRSKPKNNIVKSNSSFVSRVIPNDSLTKRLHERSPEGIFAFANVNRAFQWLDLSSSNKEDNLTKILFTKAHCLSHDVNQATKSQSHLDVIMGFSTGDVIWYEPMSQKYARLNKNGIICNSPVVDIRWLPHSDNLFLAAHMDGSLVFYDKEKEDIAFAAEEMNGHVEKSDDNDGHHPRLEVKKSVHSKNQKANPVALWHVSNQRINGFSFSPDSKHLAIVSEDGSLRVIDYHQEKLLDLYPSYYGGMLCVCWSPDSRYILTGGQDDLVSIWSLADGVLVARCQGHNSWVTAVAFDPWRCDDRNYRFGSVGEDCRLLLWDFSVGMLHRPRAASVRQRTSITSQFPLSRNRTEGSTTRLRSNSNLSAQSLTAEEITHPVQSRTRTAILPPVMAKVVDDDPLCWLGFEEDCILTSCKEGHIRTWDRPKESTGSSDDTPSITGSS